MKKDPSSFVPPHRTHLTSRKRSLLPIARSRQALASMLERHALLNQHNPSPGVLEKQRARTLRLSLPSHQLSPRQASTSRVESPCCLLPSERHGIIRRGLLCLETGPTAAARTQSILSLLPNRTARLVSLTHQMSRALPHLQEAGIRSAGLTPRRTSRR